MDEKRSIYRMLDANLNRALEALRVIEDYARFALDSRILTERAKTLRHRLTQALLREESLEKELIFARDTLRDVGTDLARSHDLSREGLGAILHANFRRLEEALRVLEESLKVERPEAAREVQEIRYETYTLEKELEFRRVPKEALKKALLYVILDTRLVKGDIIEVAKAVATSGTDVIQLRDKVSRDREVFSLALKLRDIAHGANVLFLINDRPDIAALSNADGVHLGQEDLAVSDARRLLGPGKVVGVSAHSVAEARRAEEDGADYIGLGAIFPTETKEKAIVQGVSLIREVLPLVSIPVFVLGGIRLENLNEVMAAGAKRVAVGSGLIATGDPGAAARAFKERLEREI